MIGHHERMVDWGNRSVHAVLQAARPVVAASTGREAERSYYVGCSTGGGQGLAEIQRYPADFDGTVIGAPGNNRTRLNAYFLWMYAANHHDGQEIIPATKLPVITQAAIDSCDQQNGSKDGFYDQAACHFDPAKLLCSAAATNVFGNQGATPPQIDAQHDLTTALDQWVNGGPAPNAIIAANVSDGTVTRSRPLCKFPASARYTGAGDRRSAASWECQTP